MKLVVNGEPKEAAAVADLAELLRSMGIDPGGSGFAVALNGEVVPKRGLSERALKEGDRVEIVHAVQGG